MRTSIPMENHKVKKLGCGSAPLIVSVALSPLVTEKMAISLQTQCFCLMKKVFPYLQVGGSKNPYTRLSATDFHSFKKLLIYIDFLWDMIYNKKNIRKEEQLCARSILFQR